MTISKLVPVYLDESGSLPDEASHFVVVVCVNIKGERIERIMRKVRRRIPKTKTTICQKVFFSLAEEGRREGNPTLSWSYASCRIFTVAFGKQGVKQVLHSGGACNAERVVF